ncbi:hypothetical protein Ae201684P_005537 [Aphanomyces euteiches]|uniref:Uncharacterized protein n=1 Tax=Aphanomyces euteiches TaxID=100861 RepID=A0A6G0X1E2_9STRA|nr:hypothetical protein Ae201684_009531 [Aphanomyces euteiches]KAH9085837.1 hypothetical protein Ae201684P_005537 [Aphanomyces euteiches]
MGNMRSSPRTPMQYERVVSALPPPMGKPKLSMKSCYPQTTAVSRRRLGWPEEIPDILFERHGIVAINSKLS